MIIQENNTKDLIFFTPEDLRERKYLEDKFPGLLKEGLHFFSRNDYRLIQNLYTRLRAKFKSIKYTEYVLSLLKSRLELPELPDTFKYYTAPLPFQDLALRYCYSRGYGAGIGLLLEPGLGKTKVTLDYIHLMGFSKALVVCPKPLLFVWEEEVAKHRPELSIYVIKTTDWEKEKASIEQSQITVVNYDKAKILYEQLREVGYEFITLDEGLIKDYTTDRAKLLTKLGNSIPNRMLASGTLVNNSPLDVFAPIRFLEPSLIGRTVTQFKDRYVISRDNIIFGFRDTEEIKTILQSCSIVMRKEEWLPNLPKKQLHKIVVRPSDVQREYYTQLNNNHLLIKEWGEVEVNNPLTKLAKLLQISNGFLYYQEQADETEIDTETGLEIDNGPGERKTQYFKDQPKIETLVNLLSSELKGRRTLVWFNMQAERELLENAFKDHGISYITISGGEKKIGEKVNKFNNDPSLRILLCQAKTINYGVTTLGRERKESEYTDFEPRVSDEIFYSISFSLEVFLQQQDRIHRIGQTEVCNYWVLITDTEVEDKVVQALDSKMRINRDMLIDISKLNLV